MASSDTTRLTLLLRLRDRSDSLSWEEFHDRYGELLYRYARGRGATHADAEDIVQEVEMYVFKAMSGFEYDARKGRFRSYLRTAVVHAMGRRASKAAKQAAFLDPKDFDYVAAEKESTADNHWELEWRHHRLRWALRTVAHEFEDVTMRAFQIHALGGATVEETASRLDISKASVYQAKSRVLKRIRSHLEALDPEADL
ncbi:MAG: RNA polymerase sigma factor [Planctomycetota bacterium]